MSIDINFPLRKRNKSLSVFRIKNHSESSTKGTMRSLTCDQPLLSIDPVSSVISLSNDSTDNHHRQFIQSIERTKSSGYLKNEHVTQRKFTETSIRTKSRVPDILMINKYYGLVPQKFAISSRKPVSLSSTPSSASISSRRVAHSSSVKPRAKSCTLQHYYQRHQERKSGTFRDARGHRSENDSPEPIRMVLVTGKGSTESESTDEKSADPFGPVTKRMSVEKYKKWRNNGGGHKGINLNMQGSIGQTLSLVDNGFKSHARKNGGVASMEYGGNRRVIKIDLNSVSWNEESYEVSTSPERATGKVNKEDELSSMELIQEAAANSVLFRDHKTNDFQENKSLHSCLSSSSDNGHISYLGENIAQLNTSASRDSCHQRNKPLNNYEKFGEGESSELENMTSEQTSHSGTLSSSPTMSQQTSSTSSNVSMENEVIEKHGTMELTDSSIENIPRSLKDPKVAGYGKLSQKTISFDEKLLESSSAMSDGPDKIGKRRPTTAAARCSSTTFSTPNGFNPPSKIIPWTQQKTAGGKPLTLAERRAKFQRVSSIHSSSSLSVETGEEELLSEEIDSVTSANCTRPSSSAFRESRKPLYVMQPPEVPTMISQINPNADEDIQIEIEKVAIMLRKMQRLKHFSRSLDSGIETEILNRAHSVPETSLSSSSGLKSSNRLMTKFSESTDALLQNASQLSCSGSESSVSSVESISSEDKSVMGNKLRSSSLMESTKQKSIGNNSKVIKGEEMSSRKGRLHSNQRSFSDTSNSSALSTARKTLSSPSPQGGTTTTPQTNRATVHRPPLKKAVSISCEQELLKAGGGSRQNEVNSNVANDNGKSGRPKTAVGAGAASSQTGYGAGTCSTHTNNFSHQRQNSLSSSESHQAASNSGSQGSRNRKILIKKALMEINQSSVNLRRKWGTLGRPRTAPTSEKNVVHHGTMSQQQHPTNAQQKRKPMKASPFAISGNGKVGSTSSGKPSLQGGGNFNGMERGNTEKCTPSLENSTNQNRAISESPEESCDKSEPQGCGDSPPSSNKGRSMFRQCFSLDESALLGFSIKSVEEGQIPIFDSSSESGITSILNDELSFLSSKKREQCLKVYEKMTKTGCTIKLDTIFRGMLTPSEYRAFMRAAEKAAIEAEERKKLEESCSFEDGQSKEQDGTNAQEQLETNC